MIQKDETFLSSIASLPPHFSLMSGIIGLSNQILETTVSIPNNTATNIRFGSSTQPPLQGRVIQSKYIVEKCVMQSISVNICSGKLVNLVSYGV